MGKYKRAEALARQTLDVAQAAGGEAGVYARSIALDCLGRLSCSVHDRYDEADSCYREALTLRARLCGRESPEVARLLTRLGQLRLLQDRQGEARVLLEQSQRLLEGTLETDPLLLVENLRCLAQLRRDGGEEAVAEPLLQRALILAEQQFGRHDGRLILSLCPLCSLFWHQERHDEAMRLLQRIFRILHRARNLAPADLLPCLDNLATIWRDAGRYAWARKIWKMSLVIIRRCYGRKNRYWRIPWRIWLQSIIWRGRWNGLRRYTLKLRPACAE